MSLAWKAYRMVAPAIGAIAPHARVFVKSSERPLWGERMGENALPAGWDAWIHASSMGEATAAGPLTRELLARAGGARLTLTASTLTGRDRLAKLGFPVALAPLDSPQIVAQFFSRVRPARLIVIETEIWPHWLMASRSAGTPVAFVSARLSEKSVTGYRRLGADLRDLVAGAAAVLCQTEKDAERWRRVGSSKERTHVTGNLKFDALSAPVKDRSAARAALGLDPDRPALTLGSLRPGEARLLARAWRELPREARERWQVVAVPRHARAGAELRSEADHEGVKATAGGVPHAGEWRWDARPGVLDAYYGASEVAFVGGSLVPLGGHNPLEPAARAAAVLMGSDGSHQLGAVERLREHRGIVIVDGARLPSELGRVLGDDQARADLGAGALRAVDSLRGAAARTVRALETHGLWPPRAGTA